MVPHLKKSISWRKTRWLRVVGRSGNTELLMHGFYYAATLSRVGYDGLQFFCWTKHDGCGGVVNPVEWEGLRGDPSVQDGPIRMEGADLNRRVCWDQLVPFVVRVREVIWGGDSYSSGILK